MIDIYVNNTPLLLSADTKLTLEQNASWGDVDNVGGDIVWTFDMPAEGNERTLEQAGYVVVSAHKKYDCEIRYDGMPLATGQLYIQDATDEKTLSCGITMNPMGQGWGDKKLKEDDWGEVQQIADSLDDFKQKWKDFLKSTLDEDSYIKFMLFCDSEFSEDEDFGYYRNVESQLDASKNENQYMSYVNRLFFAEDGTIYDNSRDVYQGVRIFNQDSGAANGHKVNGYRFAPALRLVWMIRKMIAEAGMTLTGSWAKNAMVQRLFVQSMCSMDGDIRQYAVSNYLNITNKLTPAEQPVTRECQAMSVNGELTYWFTIDSNQGEAPQFSYRYLLPVDDLARNKTLQTPVETIWNEYDEVYMLAVMALDAEFPAFLYKEPDYGLRIAGTGTISKSTILEGYDVNYTPTYDVAMIQITSSEGVNAASDNDEYGAYTMATIKSFVVRNYLRKSTQAYCVKIVKCKVYTTDETLGITVFNESGFPAISNRTTTERSVLQRISDLEVIDTTTLDYNDTPLNIFQNELDLTQHVPNKTNSDMLKELAKMFGLNIWMGDTGSQVQLDFWSDVKNAGSIDVTDYVTSIKKTTFSPRYIKGGIDTVLKQSDLNEKFVLDSVATRDDLPKADMHKNKHCLVKVENVYMRSTKDSDSSKYSWEQSAAANDKWEVGDNTEDEETESTEWKVVNMRTVDTATTTPKYLMEIPQRGVSAMFDDTYTGEFDVILTQYRGKRLLALDSNAPVPEAYIECGNPTWWNEDGTKDETMLNLTATGDNSIGEMWQKPYWEWVANHEEIELTMTVPARVMLQIYRLTKPQEGTQTRWVTFRSQRYLPKKISYEFGSGHEVKITMTCGRERYE